MTSSVSVQPWSWRKFATPSNTAGSDSPAASLTQCLATIATLAAVVLLAHGAAIAVTRATLQHTTALTPALAATASPLLIGIYQLALLAIAVRWFAADRATALGLVWPRLRVWHWVAIVVGLYALKAGASLAVLTLTAPAGPAGGTTAAAQRSLESLSPFIAVMKTNAWPLLLAGGILAAIVEELLYRGFLSRTLEASRLGVFGGALLASVIWAGVHLYYPLGLQAVLVVMGLALSWLRRRTGSVLPGMAWHIANNAVALIVMRFAL